jgi:sugar lactone lactonase YvrE
MLAVVLMGTGLVIATGSAAARAWSPSEVPLPGPAFFPESITAAPNGALFVSSLVTGEIVRIPPGLSEPKTFVVAGVNVGTAGVMVDPERGVLWACAVDLSFQTASKLRAFDLRTGALEASYTMPDPDGGVCADIALARGDVYVTDTLLGRIVRLMGTDPGSAVGGTLAVWSADPKLAAPLEPPAFLQINGIAFDGDDTLYTANYSTGELFAVGIARDGSARPAKPVVLDTPMTNPDGIRWCGGFLYVAENANGLSRIDVRNRTRTLIDDSLDQPTSLAFVGDAMWITEGQILRLQMNEPPELPFKVVRRPAPDCDACHAVRSSED